MLEYRWFSSLFLFFSFALSCESAPASSISLFSHLLSCSCHIYIYQTLTSYSIRCLCLIRMECALIASLVHSLFSFSRARKCCTVYTYRYARAMFLSSASSENLGKPQDNRVTDNTVYFEKFLRTSGKSLFY